MKRILLTLVLLLAMSVAAQAQDSPVGTLTVTGEGSATGAPDLALVRLGVQTSDEDVLAAFNSTNEITARIVDALLELGIKRNDIQTSGLSLHQERPYDPFSDVDDGTIFFWAQNSLSVTVRDISLVGQALGASVQAGANSIENLSFGITEASALEARAREMAVANARVRAEHLAELTGSQLGRVLDIDESSGDPRPVSALRAMAMMEDAGGGAATVEEGQLSVRVELRITWELEQ